MPKYIELEALLTFANNHKDGMIDANDIARFPVSDVEAVRHGKWISYLDGDHIMPEIYYQCSECGRRGYTRMHPYCNCGAKMDGKG